MRVRRGQLLAIPSSCKPLPQLRHIAAINPNCRRPVGSRTLTTRSATKEIGVRNPRSPGGVVGASLWSRKASMSMGAPLYALIAAIKRSPIVVRLSERLLLARDWATVRKSADVDAYVLAWIASHVRGRPPRTFM